MRQSTVFNSRLSKVYGRQPLKNWSDLVCLSRPYPFKIFKDCLPPNLLGLLLNTCLNIQCTSFAKELVPLKHSWLFSSYKERRNTLVVKIKPKRFHVVALCPTTMNFIGKGDSKEYLRPCQRSMMEFSFEKIVWFWKISIIDIWQWPKHDKKKN